MGSCRDSRYWSLEVGGRLIQVVVKAGFTVIAKTQEKNGDGECEELCLRRGSPLACEVLSLK